MKTQVLGSATITLILVLAGASNAQPGGGCVPPTFQDKTETGFDVYFDPTGGTSPIDIGDATVVVKKYWNSDSNGFCDLAAADRNRVWWVQFSITVDTISSYESVFPDGTYVSNGNILWTETKSGVGGEEGDSYSGPMVNVYPNATGLDLNDLYADPSNIVFELTYLTFYTSTGPAVDSSTQQGTKGIPSPEPGKLFKKWSSMCNIECWCCQEVEVKQENSDAHKGDFAIEIYELVDPASGCVKKFMVEVCGKYDSRTKGFWYQTITDNGGDCSDAWPKSIVDADFTYSGGDEVEFDIFPIGLATCANFWGLEINNWSGIQAGSSQIDTSVGGGLNPKNWGVQSPAKDSLVHAPGSCDRCGSSGDGCSN